MPEHEPPSGPPSQPGPRYQGNQISGNARVQLGDIYNFSREDPLSLLPFATHARFNSYHRQHEPTCLRNTRAEVLQKISQWADSEDQQCLFWLSGMAGTGKSTIASTLARDYFESGQLAASFFFSKGGGDVGNASKFVTTIARQLAIHVLPIQQHIRDVLTKDSIITSQSLAEQWRQLVFQPLSKLDGSNTYLSYVLVIDALDECEGEKDTQAILRLLAEARSLTTVRLRVFLTSRPEIPIRNSMRHIPQAEHQDFILHNVPPKIINHDIFLFLEHNLGIIRQELTLGADWPGEVVLRQLVLNACGLFIWASTACRFIRDGKQVARKRLDKLLKSSRSAITAPEKHLNEIYLTVLKYSIPSELLDEEKEEVYDMLKYTLGSLVALLSPLSTSSLSRLLQLPREDVVSTFNDLHAILDIPEDPTRPLRLHHPSFRDFLLSKDRCGDFWVDEKRAHQILAAGCIQLMSQTLKKDICRKHTPGSQASQVESSRLQKCLPPEVQYACLYWVQHLQRGGSQLHDGEEAHRFLQVHFLHWLEALSWMQKVSEGIHAITSLELIALTSDCPNLYAFVHDMKRFALYSRQMIQQAPLQVYCSGLVFAPEMSVVRNQFKDQVPQWIERFPEVEKDWSASLQTLEGHSGPVTSVGFSSDWRLLASASEDETVRLWDAATGAAIQTLEGHSGPVMSIAFSSDGRQLASASTDRTIRLWDVATGAALQTLEGHSGPVMSVAFSPDGRLLASADDETVRLWDAATGAAIQTLEGHSGPVMSVAFSPDGRLLASASDDETIRLWDAATGAALYTLEGHRNAVTSVVFSPDGQQLASASWDKTVRLWDAATGAALQTLEGHRNAVTSVVFLLNGRLLASASLDRTVQLWEADRSAALQMLEGHRNAVTSVAFSPDGRQLASASMDRTIQLWDTATGAALQTLEGHQSEFNLIGFSPDGRQLASASGDSTVRLWDTATGALMQTLEGHESGVSSVAFSPDGRQLASASGDRTVRLWDVATGAALQTLEGHSNTINAVAFSPDGRQLASASWDKTVRLWDTATGAALYTLKGHSDTINAVAFSPDGRQLASASWDKTVRLWDTATGAALQTLEGHRGIRTLLFSMDGSQLQTNRGSIQLQSILGNMLPGPSNLPKLLIRDEWIIREGARLLWLPHKYRSAAMAVNSRMLAIGQDSGRISILAFSLR